MSSRPSAVSWSSWLRTTRSCCRPLLPRETHRGSRIRVTRWRATPWCSPPSSVPTSMTCRCPSTDRRWHCHDWILSLDDWYHTIAELRARDQWVHGGVSRPGHPRDQILAHASTGALSMTRSLHFPRRWWRLTPSVHAACNVGRVLGRRTCGHCCCASRASMRKACSAS